MKAWPLALLLITAGQRAVSAGDTARWEVRIDVQMVELSTGEALPLIPKLRRPETAAAAWEQVQALLAAGTAQLLAWPMLQGGSGERCTSESSLEMRYDTEFNPPLIPQRSSGREEPKLPEKFPTRTVPTTFETRNTGSNLEAEPLVNPLGREVELLVRASWIRPAETTAVIGVGWEGLNGGRFSTPKFSKYEVQTSMTVKSGGHALLASFVPPVPERKILLFLLHAVAVAQPSIHP